MNATLRSAPIVLFVLLAPAQGDPPLWWADGNPPVTAPGAGPNHHGPANLGQAKWMAKRALETLAACDAPLAAAIEQQLTQPQANGHGGMLPAILDFAIPNPPQDAAWRDRQHAPLLLGQLKAIATPFYDQLHAAAPAWLDYQSTDPATQGQLQLNGTKDPADPANFYPWTSDPGDDANHAIATIGQLKAVFSLRFDTLADSDSDHDGMPDLWEFNHDFNPNDPSDAADDPDGDGMTNLEEYNAGTDPLSPGIHAFAETYNPDGTITYTWVSIAALGDWFRIEDELPDGTRKTLYETTYGSAKLPYVSGVTSYSLTLDPATDYLP